MDTRDRRDLFSCGRKCISHTIARGTADYVVAIERRCEVDSRIEVIAKLIPKLPQFIELQVAEFNALFERKAHRISDFFVSRAEGNAFVNKVRRRGHGVKVARLCCLAHPVTVELQGC